MSENILSRNVKESEKNILDFWIYTHLYQKLIGFILGQGPCSVLWNHRTEKYVSETWTWHTRVQFSEQRLQFGVAVPVIVFGQVAPESLDGGSALLQQPGQERVHGLVDPFSALPFQSILWKQKNKKSQDKLIPFLQICAII